MKTIYKLAVAFSVLLPSIAVAQPPEYIRNSTGASLGLSDKQASSASVSDSGAVYTTIASGTPFAACGTATASTADVAIKAAVASNKIYVTSIQCSNSSATTATNINFKDGTTVVAVGGVSQMATTADGAFVVEFPVPLKGTTNTALNFNTAVSVSSVVCCAQGYTSVN